MNESKQMYMVFGGEMDDVSDKTFKNPDAIEVVGFYRNYKDAFSAWRGAAQRTVDSAETRFFIVTVDHIQKESLEPSGE